jgi:hypothetical protein
MYGRHGQPRRRNFLGDGGDVEEFLAVTVQRQGRATRIACVSDSSVDPGTLRPGVSRYAGVQGRPGIALRLDMTLGTHITLCSDIQQLCVSRKRASAPVCLVDEPLHEVLAGKFRQRNVLQPDAAKQGFYVEGVVTPYPRDQADTGRIEPQACAGERIQTAATDLPSPGARDGGHDVVDGDLSDDDQIGLDLCGQKIPPEVRAA